MNDSTHQFERDGLFKKWGQFTSYPAYLQKASSPKWLIKEATLDLLGSDLEKYAEFIETKREQEIYKNRNNLPRIIGDKNFRKRILKK